MELVFVYLGSRIPSYLEKNLELLSLQFPDYPIVLLSDDPMEIERIRVKIPKVKAVLVSNPEISWADTLSASEHPQNFRENFWGKTIARFYSIYEYMAKQPEQEILHIEADVWLSPNFPLNRFLGLSKSLAYPLTNIDQGVASTVYFRNFAAAKLLKQFSELSMFTDSSTTDVSVLGGLYRAYPSEVLVLPTAPSADFVFHSHVDVKTKICMSSNYSQFNGVFDASTWGQFITGEDPRNNIGIKAVYHHQEHHSVCPRHVVYEYASDSRILGTYHDMQFEIFSLHVHSKNEKIFSVQSSFSTIRKYCINYAGTEKREFYPRVFLIQIFPFLVYRLKIIVRKVFR
jgi:hypothetical protein